MTALHVQHEQDEQHAVQDAFARNPLIFLRCAAGAGHFPYVQARARAGACVRTSVRMCPAHPAHAAHPHSHAVSSCTRVRSLLLILLARAPLSTFNPIQKVMVVEGSAHAG